MSSFRALIAFGLLVIVVGGSLATERPCPTCHRLPTGVWAAYPWTTPFTPTCQPLFASGLPLAPEPPQPESVIRLQPIPVGPPKEPPKYRPITSEPVLPPRIKIDLDKTNPDSPPREGTRPMVPPATSAARLHMIFLVDTEAKDAGAVHVTSADLIQGLFKKGVRSERVGTILRLNSGDLEPAKIAERLAGLEVKADDTLLVFYAGPAEYDEASMGFVFTPTAGRLARDELRKQILAKNARLSILLSDPATQPSKIEPSAKTETPDPGATGLERLVFGSKGVVDVHGCSVGEFAAARGTKGGCFTLAFCREFGRPAGGWADLLESVKFTTNNLYKTYRLDVLKADDTPAPVKAIFRNQESQVPAPLTPVDNIKGAEQGQKPPAGEVAPPQYTGTRLPAALVIRLPEDAQLWLDGQRTTQTGAERQFVTMPLATDAAHVYEIRMVVNGWGGIYQVQVNPGQTTRVDLQIPTAHVVQTSVPSTEPVRD